MALPSTDLYTEAVPRIGVIGILSYSIYEIISQMTSLTLVTTSQHIDN